MTFFSKKILQELQQRDAEISSSHSTLEIHDIEEVGKRLHPKDSDRLFEPSSVKDHAKFVALTV